MDHIDPFQMVSPFHLAWLYRLHAEKLDVSPSELDMIETHCPLAAEDPLFVNYRDRAESGQLRRRPGRKPLSSFGWLRLWAARFGTAVALRE